MKPDFAAILGDGVDPELVSLLELAHATSAAAYDVAKVWQNWSMAPGHVGQHVGDVAADEAAIAVLNEAGVAILSEESGITAATSRFLAVIDPVDGSSNVARGIPLWCSSTAILVDGVLSVAVIKCAPFGEEFWAVRGGGAYRGAIRLKSNGATTMRGEVAFINGFQSRHLGWAQSRALGSAALELCYLAAGVGGAFIDASRDGLAIWDYFGALLVCDESGHVTADRDGRDIRAVDISTRRHILAASSREMLQEIESALAD